jgi:alkanesulfonate monooxygenase SsuD/methylene tetrahydromethanopterin reductase-like flavin-dependent oxidoreductase (luciferase family)
MWEQVDYSYEGEHFTVPTPHNVLPKPYGKGHPPIWVACGNPPTFTRAGELGIGAIAFNFEPIFNLRGRIEAYKEGIAKCTDPIGQFKNDNVMITNSVICCETREEARKIALRNGRGYLVTMVNLYHDTMPKSQDAITWPSAPLSLRDLAAGDEEALLDSIIDGGLMLCGTPDEVSEQIARWGDVGMDQLVFGMPVEGMHKEEVLACLELFGDKVIPEFDPDRTHSTDRYRATAQPKFPRFNHPLPDAEWPTVIPESALVQL